MLMLVATFLPKPPLPPPAPAPLFDFFLPSDIIKADDDDDDDDDAGMRKAWVRPTETTAIIAATKRGRIRR
jgi:hypothetical protein